MGPGGIWQTKKALRDSQRGIDKMQIGYYNGDQSEVIEQRLDPPTRQYQQETHRQSLRPNEMNYPHQWRAQSQPQLQLPSPQQYQYYRPQQQQQRPFYAQQPLQALPAPSPYQYL